MVCFVCLVYLVYLVCEAEGGKSGTCHFKRVQPHACRRRRESGISPGAACPARWAWWGRASRRRRGRIIQSRVVVP